MNEQRFNFREEYLMVAEKLFVTNEEKTDFLKAIIRYGLFKEEPNLTETMNSVFSLIKIIIDKDREFTDTLRVFGDSIVMENPVEEGIVYPKWNHKKPL